MKRVLVVVAILLSACAGQSASTTLAPTTTSTTSSTTTTSTTVSTSTSTSVAPSTTVATPDRTGSGESIAGTFDGILGYVGCSMSKNAAEGYVAVGGTNMWSFRAPYGGGTIGRWNNDITGDGGTYWGGFAKELDLNPNTSVLWWNLCTVKSSPQDSFENALLVLEEIEARIPGVVVYVSAQPAYTGDHVCALAGPEGPENMQLLADELVGAGVVLEGPTMGPLTRAETRDGCHANDEGQAILGQQLLDFFG